ncbi:histone-lysine N-methyltransferase set-1-like [Carassius auratus]|uniref:Histone-lysine N-methyltransferase set-1-like n=1 Tax=Carassius auratus TaxID=7957 RepID=A0A6P6P2T0_CARAU|nr:histone-lysine N-methyltransferase set-1-like [Carassius auratus]
MLGNKRRRKPLQDAEHHITCKTDKPGLREQFISKYKGRGVFTTGAFFRGDFVLEYRGELLSSQESLDRTEHYTEAENTFLFDFQWHGKNWCMDASKEDSSLGRLANDETRNPTCKMRTVEVSRKPHLCLFAVRDILPGEEITYNYGDSDWPWRVKTLNKASESTDKKPASSLRLHKSPHCAVSVSSPELDKVNSNGPHKQSGKSRTSRNKTKQFRSRLLQSSSVASTSDAPSSSAPCALFTSIMALSTSCPPALSSSPSTTTCATHVTFNLASLILILSPHHLI